MNAAFLDRIERPRPRRLERLRDEAIKNVKAELPDRTVDVHDEAVFRKLAFTFYYDWTADDPEYVMFSEDPGGITARHTSDIVEFAELPADDPLAQVGIYRKFAIRWLASDNYGFSEKFFETCAGEGLIDLDQPVRSYIRSEAMYDDFYLTDANKYRTSVSSAPDRAALAAAFTTTELAELEPDLIFAFGNDAWEVVTDELALTPVDGSHDPDAGITEFDGRLYESRRLVDTHVIPLLHMSGQAFGTQRSQDEYAKRLQQGIARWREVSSS